MPEMPGPPKIILVVDDDAAIVKMLRLQLEKEGHASLAASTGKEAVEIAATTGLAMVLLDLGLPDMPGFDVLAAIKKLKPGLSVIIVTGNHQESEARKAFELGALDYVTKPIDMPYLKNSLLPLRA